MYFMRSATFTFWTAFVGKRVNSDAMFGPSRCHLQWYLTDRCVGGVNFLGLGSPQATLLLSYYAILLSLNMTVTPISAILDKWWYGPITCHLFHEDCNHHAGQTTVFYNQLAQDVVCPPFQTAPDFTTMLYKLNITAFSKLRSAKPSKVTKSLDRNLRKNMLIVAVLGRPWRCSWVFSCLP